MQRRTFLIGATSVGLAGLFGGSALAQTAFSLSDIRPTNPLETAFLAAFREESARPAFRQQMVRQPLTLALASAEEDAAPLEVSLPENRRAVAVFTSADRLTGVLGGNAPRVSQPGRQILTRLRGQHVVLNYRLLPMLTLEPEDVEALLALPV